jgi:hypothetical protein
MPVKIAATITFCQLLLRNAREVIVEQLELSGLKIREGSGIAPVDATVRRCGRSDGSDSDGGFSSGRRKD